MPIPTIENVRPALENFETRIRTVFEGAWQDWIEMPRRAILSPRSRASMVFDFIKQRALVEFDGDPDVHIISKGQTVKFLFKGCVLVRFKKANASGVGSNIETQAVLEFVDPQFVIPGLLPDIFRVEVCYGLDPLATRMEHLAVTARNRQKKLWSYELQRTEVSVVTLPQTREPPPTPPEVRIRKPNDKANRGE